MCDRCPHCRGIPGIADSSRSSCVRTRVAHLLPLVRMLRDTKVTLLCLVLWTFRETFQKQSRDRKGCRQHVRKLSQGAVEGTEPRKQQRAAGRMCSPGACGTRHSRETRKQCRHPRAGMQFIRQSTFLTHMKLRVRSLGVH